MEFKEAVMQFFKMGVHLFTYWNMWALCVLVIFGSFVVWQAVRDYRN